MLAKLADELPSGGGVLYEPKWDGFRAIVFRGPSDVYIQSRDLRPLDRYFPDLHEALLAALPEGVFDGEIVIATSHGLDFDALQMRLHPAASRVAKLAAATPASFVAFDLLADGRRDLRGTPLSERRAHLERLLAGVTPPIYLTPMTRDRKTAADWLARFEGAGLDGVIAKPEGGIYEPGKRAMIKIKHSRTADCVVAGFRWHKNGTGTRVGSLLLGLYDENGALQHVGVTSSFTMASREQLARELAPLRKGALDGHPWREWAKADPAAPKQKVEGAAKAEPAAPKQKVEEAAKAEPAAPKQKVEEAAKAGEVNRMPGGQSRWSAGKDLSWEPLRVERVCEVKYDHMQGDRFRHAAVFQRWRPDKPPAECTYDQLEVTTPYELAKVFGAAGDAG